MHKLLLPSILGLVFGACKPVVTADQASVKIVGGSAVEAKDNLAKFTVKLGSCTSSLVSKRWLLTAGHCVVDSSGNTKDLEAYFGIGLAKAPFKRISVEKVVTHPDMKLDNIFSPNDIALVKLSEDAPDFYKPVKLADEKLNLMGKQVKLAGFGKQGSSLMDLDRKLEKRVIELSNQSNLDPVKEILGRYQDTKNNENNNLNGLKKDSSLFKYDDRTSSPMGVLKSKGSYMYSFSEVKSIVGELIPYFSSDEKVQKIASDRDKAMRNGFNQVFLKTQSEISRLVNDFIIYRSNNGINSACSGDSGGPMVLESGGESIQVGVTHSANLESVDSVLYCKGSGVYMNVARYRGFIDSVISQ